MRKTAALTYVIRARGAGDLVELRGGRVRQIGIASGRLTGPARSRTALLAAVVKAGRSVR